MSQSQFVMVLVVEHVEQISVERVNILDFREMLQSITQFFGDGVLAELDLAHIERSYSGDGIAGVHDSGGFALGLGEHDVDEIGSGRDHLDVLEIVAHVPTVEIITILFISYLFPHPCLKIANSIMQYQ